MRERVTAGWSTREDVQVAIACTSFLAFVRLVGGNYDKIVLLVFEFLEAKSQGWEHPPIAAQGTRLVASCCNRVRTQDGNLWCPGRGTTFDMRHIMVP